MIIMRTTKFYYLSPSDYITMRVFVEITVDIEYTEAEKEKLDQLAEKTIAEVKLIFYRDQDIFSKTL